MKRGFLILAGLIIVIAVTAIVYRLESGSIETADLNAIQDFEQRLKVDEGSDRLLLKMGDSTVSVDESAGTVTRRGAAGNIEWSTPLGENLRNWYGPSLFTDGRRIFVERQFKGVSALEPDTGRVAWQVDVPNECFLLSGDLLLVADARLFAALAVDSGAEVFRLSLPADDQFRPTEIKEATGLFIVQAHEDPGGKGDTFLIDRAGQIRFRFPRQVVDVVAVDQDRIFLTSADVRRITPDGRTVWSTPFADPEWIAGGKMLQALNGDLVAFLYGRIANTGVQLIRFSPDSGKLVWQSSCGGLRNVTHSAYRHRVDVTLIEDQVRIISQGSAGTFVAWVDANSGKRLRRNDYSEEWIFNLFQRWKRRN